MSEEDGKVIHRSIDPLTGVREVSERFLSILNELQKTRSTILEGEVKRLHNAGPEIIKDTRVNMLKENIIATNHMVNALNVQLETSKIIIPMVKEGETLVHGRITDENGYGKKNLVVSLIVEGQKLDIVGKSNASGYYSIILPSTIVKRIKQNDIFMYIHYGTVLIHKAEDPIKISDQQQVKFEVILSEDEIRMIHLQEKDKEVNPKTGKIKKR